MLRLAVRKQRGVYLVLATFLLVFLIAISALAIDVGRLALLKSEMHNAVDAAAIAAAVELNGDTGSVGNSGSSLWAAANAARNYLSHERHAASDKELLSNVLLPDEAFTFYCSIGNSFDDPDLCLSSTVEPDGKIITTDGSDAKYVKIDLLPGGVGSLVENYSLDLFFLPLLNFYQSVADVSSEAGVSVSALAGKSFIACQYPPLFVCNPPAPHSFSTATPGFEVVLKAQSGPSSLSGNFHFLTPAPSSDGKVEKGANAASQSLANPDNAGCTPPLITSEPGGMTQKMVQAVNTRFNDYGPTLNLPSACSSEQQCWPAAPDIVEYPDDSSLVDDKYGNGDWHSQTLTGVTNLNGDSCDGLTYFQCHHPGVDPAATSLGATPSRYDTYIWELEAANTNPAPYPSVGLEDMANTDRRTLWVGVLDCASLDTSGGRFDVLLQATEPQGFAKFFVYRRASGPPNANIYAEFADFGGTDAPIVHLDVQLYE